MNELYAPFDTSYLMQGSETVISTSYIVSDEMLSSSSML